MDDILKLKELINNSNRIVIFSGAGLSTNSGIPDFRSANGIYNQKSKINYPPEEIISHSFFMNNPEMFYDFYFDKMVYPKALPNLAHKYFAHLEKQGKVLGIVTQNIDDLHQMAGSKKVYELHGSVKRNYCMRCHKYYPLEALKAKGIPYCNCGGMIKPDVVLYEEGLDEECINKAINAIAHADLLIVVGTSLTVYPAAGFIRYFRGENLVLLNKSHTPYDNIANLVIHMDIKDIILGLGYEEE